MNHHHHLETMATDFHERIAALEPRVKLPPPNHDGLSIAQKLDGLSPFVKNELIRFLSR